MSTLYQQWQNIAYDETADRSQLEKFWGTYFQFSLQTVHEGKSAGREDTP